MFLNFNLNIICLRVQQSIKFVFLVNIFYVFLKKQKLLLMAVV